MPLLGVTNPLVSGSKKEASKNCKRIIYTHVIFCSPQLFVRQVVASQSEAIDDSQLC